MEGFSCLLDYNIAHGPFTYHPQCKELAISHVSFADDLFLLASATEGSLSVIKTTLQQFESMAGLKANTQKSCTYLAGVRDEERIQLQNILGMPVGNLSVKYLGVPITTRLRKQDRQSLIEKITARITHWTPRNFTYAGRVQLVISVLIVFSVLSNISMYWCGIFVLPKRILKEVDKILKIFIWQRNAGKGIAKIAWEQLCLPKEEGGLGLRDARTWNQALMMRHIWDICAKKHNLWIKWCHTYMLIGNYFWMVKCATQCSWTWRKLLKLRLRAQPLIRYKIGNRRDTSLWWDNCHSMGPLINKYGRRLIYDTNMGEEALVDNIIQQGRWT